ncbi:hypothetical protein [Micromonospora mirobrigensis]|nr:hypothetical protein [Micromonospora mirobrigensis]
MAAVVLALPSAVSAPNRSGTVGAAGTTVSLGGVSVAVPDGWRTSEVADFDPCTAEPHTVYLAAGWQFRGTAALAGSPRGGPVECRSDGQAWVAVVERGFAPTVNPARLVVNDGQLLQAEEAAAFFVPSAWAYRPFTQRIEATAAVISGDEQQREQLLDRVTWPAGPAAPASGGLALPGRITSATSAAPPSNAMVVATDAKTLARIRTALTALRDPVRPGEECTLRQPGAVGISLGSVTVVLGDATCPQAVSSGGGRVRAPAGLGRELLGLIAARNGIAIGRVTTD